MKNGGASWGRCSCVIRATRLPRQGTSPCPTGFSHDYPRSLLFIESLVTQVGARNPFSYQSLMPAGAGTPRYEIWRHPPLPSWIPDFAIMTIASTGGFRIHVARRVTSISYQSLIPTVAGIPRDENPELPFRAANSHRGFCHAPPPAPAGDKPPRYILLFRLRTRMS